MSMSDFAIINKLGGCYNFKEVYRYRVFFGGLPGQTHLWQQRVRTQKGKIPLSKMSLQVNMNKLSEKERENALNEVRILASIRSQQVLGYRDSFFEAESNTLCLVMEYAD